MKTNTRLKMAVQNKGRLGTQVLELLSQAGLSFDRPERALLAKCGNFPLDLLFVRHSDVPLLVQEGAADVGIVGSDLLAEECFEVSEGEALGLARSRLCLAVPEDSSLQRAEDLQGKTVATNFPSVTQQWFEQRGIEVKIERLRGSVEIAPRIELAEAVVDLVGTGTTMQINRLRIVDTLLEASGLLIHNPRLSEAAQELVDELSLRLMSVVNARGKKLLIINLPKAALEELKAINPGLSGPTVTEVKGDAEMLSVQIVVDESDTWEVMKAIRAIGGSGILVVNIERLLG